MKKRIFISIGLMLCAAVVGYFFLYFFNRKDSSQEAPSRPVQESAQGPVEEIIPEGSRKFTSEPFLFSLVIPEGLHVEEFDEAGDARTFVFTNLETKYSFQVYVTPYGKDHIDSERFLLDQPSGVREEEQQITIDGVPALVYGGKNDSMGETREVWFIYRGFLYEVTTYRELDAWLAQIMTSWKFVR